MMERGATGAVASIAPYTFVAANIAVALIAIGTLRLILNEAFRREPLRR
jgi:hypothetical protein